MKSNTLMALNNHLFEQIERLSDDRQLNETIYNTAELQAKLSNMEEEE